MQGSRPIIAIDARLAGGQSTGDSTYWTSLLNEFAQREHAFRLLAFGRGSKPSGLVEGVEWVDLPSRSGRWWSLVQFPLAARKAGAAAVHVQYTLSPLAKNGITTIHDVSFLIGPQWFPAKDRLLLSRSVPSSARRAKKVITVSEASKGEIERLIPAVQGKVRATPLACAAWIKKSERERAKERLVTLGITEPFLLTVGTRWPRKNMKLAVDAANLLPQRLPHQLVITGKHGWGSSDLGGRGLAAGYVSNDTLCDLYSAADLYLAPSFHEGFGLPLLEAFRCGCPVLCSNGGAFPEVAGDAALVQDSWEPASWARAIEAALDDRCTLEDLRNRGFEREKQFNWRRTAEQTLEVYREVTM